ncbi:MULTISPECIES: putative quinol monooxygenase [unclassified Cryobacterium]|uniref:putative quinol monooxygenase n=1 Tax=unclassified Cryobacterium TaxID=2649013 RepID=UPI002AB3760F|nr:MULTISPECIES: putative quinol monooxygenase [unclassified Cryobacterium]MDY7544275.1 putative quinol monooxygenase [Cryobacterium sp. 5B3]MEA9999308.1 putative quinol monooxygenase [Cryobacterium sp. RTS3]MEB0264641.1 putative quinol monooxygenase [Cryobacterium sp. 10I5]MEB0275560.1 putative quinol monooxygenase [Cryobacterium sp. 5B3]
MSVVVVATITPLDGHLQNVVDAFAVVSPKVHAEPGNELYALHRDAGTVVMIERWASPADLAAHAAGEAITELNALVAEHVSGPSEVRVLENVPLGDPLKGSIQ